MEAEENMIMKRRRVARACDSCRRKKVRCDGVQPGTDPPACTNCKMNGFECSFIDAPKKRGPPKGYIEALETRLQRMESVLSSLVKSGEVPEGSLPNNLEWINVNETSFSSLDPRSIHQSSGYKPKPRAGDSTSPSAPQNGYDSNAYRSEPVSDEEDSDDEDDEDASSGDKDDAGTYDLNDSLGQLAIDETGMTRYLGSSSGVWLLKYTQQLAHGQALLVNRREWETNETKPKPPEVYVLPPRELCDQMVTTYFTIVHAFTPLMDKSDFMEKYRDLENNPQILVLLYAVMSITARFINDPSVRRNPDDPSTAGSDYIDHARELLKEEFDDPTLYTLQALLLLSLCQQNTKNSRSWVYTGMAIRIAQDMGLHRDSSKWNFDLRQAEVRKRVWWACFVCDRGIGAGLGRPLVIQESDCDVPLPTPGVLPDDNSETVAEFIFIIKLAKIMGHVLQHIYGIKRTSTSDSETVLMKLNAELDAWRDALPERLRYDPAMTFQDLRNQKVAAFHLMFCTIQILLHRPHIRGPNSKGTSPKLPSLTICTMAANNITHCAYRAMKEDALCLWWNHTLYSFFTAAVMHVINALSGDERFREVAKHGLRMSLKCLEYLKPHCCSAAKCIMVIQNLLKVREINLDNVTLAGDKVSKENGSMRVDPQKSSSFKLFCGVPASTDVSLSEQQKQHQRQHQQQQQTNRTIVFAPSVTTQEATGINVMNSATEYSQAMVQQMALAMAQSQGDAGLLGSNNSSPQQLPSPASSSSTTGFGMPLQGDIFNHESSVFFPTNADQLLADTRPLVLAEDVGSMPITADWDQWSEYLGVAHTGGLVGAISDTHLDAPDSMVTAQQPGNVSLLGGQP